MTLLRLRASAPVPMTPHAADAAERLGTRDEAVVAAASLFADVEPDAVAVMMRQMAEVRYAARDCIYTEGEVQDRLYVLVSGKVTLGRRHVDGRSLLLNVIGPSELFGEVSLFDPGPRTATATALTEVRAVVMDRRLLREWLVGHPEIADRLLGILARRLRRIDHDVCDLIYVDATGRVAKALLRLAWRFGVQRDGAISVVHDLTQEELAQLVGAARETVNKVMGEFVSRGWISVAGKSVLITDTERLDRRARQTPVTVADVVARQQCVASW